MPTEVPVVRPRSPLWIIVLALACEEPMHPYRMQTLIKQRGKDQVANVAQRNSVYQTIEALKRAGLIVVRETSRQERRPERTVYEATDVGRQTLQSWVRSGLATPAREFPEFPAVLSVLYGVRSSDDLCSLLEARVAGLESRLVELQKPAPGVPRLFLLESEYAVTLVKAEIRWLRGVITDARAGKLSFPTEEEMLRIGEQLGGPSENAVHRMVAEMSGSESRGKSVGKDRTARRGTSSRPRRRTK
jgi:DNA-binding PadR family transcriptional regulator